MEAPATPIPSSASIIWTNEKYMVVLCPCCVEPEYRKHTRLPVLSLCRKGIYEAKELFDFKVALLGIKHRKNDCEAKRKYRKEAATALALVRAAKQLKESESAVPETSLSSPNAVVS